METPLKILIRVACFVLIATPNVLAQEQPEKNAAFDSIRGQIQSTSRKNNDLIRQNKSLKAELIKLQLEVDQHEKELKSLDPQFQGVPKYTREQDYDYPKKSSGSKLLEEDPKIREAQELYVSGQFMELDAGQQLRELHLYDLQYEKQELQLDLIDLEAQYQQIEGGRQQELETLENEIKANEAKIKDLSFGIIELEKSAMTYPQTINLLEMENQELKRKITQMKKPLSQ